ncbi:MAG: Tol-Pal system beta propeller repeat protein TolB [Desulfococcus sp. 4484_242]|nr:MAG: Tol-Pal system beta propeller repeat protein TolB [Desulfococcus sp. 4484_242]
MHNCPRRFPSGVRSAWICWILLGLVLFPGSGLARIYIDVNAPSIPKFNIAIPDFKSMAPTAGRAHLSTELPAVLSNDLVLSGYFNAMDKGAFLEETGEGLTANSINFKNWSVIGAELLVKGGYACVGSRLEVEIRLFDVFWGRQILGKRALGDIKRRRRLMHRLSNEIILKLTGHEGIFLTKLAFVDDSSGKREICISDYDGFNVRQTTTDKSIALFPCWSPDGRYLAYSSYGHMRRAFRRKDMGKQAGPILYLKDLSTGKVRVLSSQPGLNTGAAWAPDGKQIALTMSHEGNPDIFTIDLQGRILKHLVKHWGIDVSPSFSPDGKRLAFVSNRSGSPQIYILNVDGRQVKRLTYQGRYNTSPAWSPLNRIAFVSRMEGNFDICTIGPDGGGFKRLTDNRSDDEEPCWSPDGRYLMFTSDREGSYHLYIMNANGQNQRKITSMKGNQTAPSWAPD